MALWVLLGCDLGLSQLPAYAENDLDEQNIGGQLYAVSPSDLRVAVPEGLDEFREELLDRDLLVWVRDVGDAEIGLDVALAAPEGGQDPCQVVLELPEGAWDNPSFFVGPGELVASFSGFDATFRSLQLWGEFEDDGAVWTGDLAAVLDARELAPALPDIDDVCELVEALGGSCNGCEDGSLACFDLRLTEMVGERVGSGFDPDPSCD